MVRGGLGLLRRCLPGRHPRQLQRHRGGGRPGRATLHRGLSRIRPGPRLRCRPGTGPAPRGTSRGSSRPCPMSGNRPPGRGVRRPRGRPGGCGPLVYDDGRPAHPRQDEASPGGGVRGPGGAPSVAGSRGAVRPAHVRDGQGPPRPPHRLRLGTLPGAGRPRRPGSDRPGRGRAREGLLAGCPRQGPPAPAGRRAGDGPRRPPARADRVRHARPRPLG